MRFSGGKLYRALNELDKDAYSFRRLLVRNGGDSKLIDIDSIYFIKVERKDAYIHYDSGGEEKMPERSSVRRGRGRKRRAGFFSSSFRNRPNAEMCAHRLSLSDVQVAQKDGLFMDRNSHGIEP